MGKKIETMEQQHNESTSYIGIKFLLEEFNALRSFKDQSIAIADKRVYVASGTTRYSK